MGLARARYRDRVPASSLPEGPHRGYKLVTPGVKSSEFFVAVLTVVGAIVSAAQDYLTNPQAAGLSGLAAVAYVVSRGLAKVEPRPPGDGGTP